MDKVKTILAIIGSLLLLTTATYTAVCWVASAESVEELAKVVNYGFAWEHKRRIQAEMFDIEQWLRNNPYNYDRAKWEKQLHRLQTDLDKLNEEIERITRGKGGG